MHAMPSAHAGSADLHPSRVRSTAAATTPTGSALLRFVVVCCGAFAAGTGAARSASAQDDGAMMGGGAAGSVQHDPATFRDRVLPVLLRECIGCHDADAPENRTKHRLVDAGPGAALSEAQVRANYDTVRSFLRPEAPERSVLLLKLLPAARGGVDHDGGKADEGGDFAPELVDPRGPLVAWVFGGTAGDAPPVAVWAPVPRTVVVGEEVRLDATLSQDPEGRDVTVTWEVHDAPQGARARVESPQSKVTRIVPDREGRWTIRMRTSDGKLRGWPALIRFAATRRPDATAAERPTVPGSSAPPIDSATRRATRQLFLDLRGRTPTPDELTELAPLPWSERVDRLLDDDATWQNWLDEEAFYFLLIDQFRPVSDRIVGLPAGLRDGRSTFRDAHQMLALSAEFNARNPGNDTYCTVVLEQFLGIEVQKNVKLLETAKAAYDGKLQRLFDRPVRTQSDVVAATLDQPAYVDLFLRRMARRYLGQEVPAPEHAAAAALLAADPRQFRNVLREWLLSPRYTGPDRGPRAKSDHQFIRSLFVDLLGRPPSYEEFRNMRNALQALADPTPLRGVLAKVLLDSSAALPPSDPAALPATAPVAGTPGATSDGSGAATDARRRVPVIELFHRLLGRDPSTRELDTFLAVLAEPGATWRTAAMGLMNSPQYALY